MQTTHKIINQLLLYFFFVSCVWFILNSFEPHFVLTGGLHDHRSTNVFEVQNSGRESRLEENRSCKSELAGSNPVAPLW